MLTARLTGVSASGKADTELVLPEHLRLPDLSKTRGITGRELRRLHRQAVAAIAWGPDRRNGCYRTKGLDRFSYSWTGPERQPHTPDEWTPAVTVNGYAYWWDHGRLIGRPGDQPAPITPRGLTWFSGGSEHRAHAPGGLLAATGGAALLHRRPRPVWWWRSNRPDEPLRALLDQAWANTSITDGVAHALLAQASAVPASDRLAVAPEAWVAHVLAANPSPHLSSALRGWLALLLA